MRKLLLGLASVCIVVTAYALLTQAPNRKAEGAITIDPGSIPGSVRVSLNTGANVLLTQADCKGSASWNDDADPIDYTLPGAAPGLVKMIGDAAGGVITVDVVDGVDYIILDGTALAAGNAIDSSGNIGDYITLMALDDTRWMMIGRSGPWADGGSD